ncbi:MAG: hypothetical protein WCK29_02950, partial [archaeon]
LIEIPERYLLVPPADAELRRLEIHSITGWLSQLPDIRSTIFGGFFRYDPSTGDIIHGRLIDAWGESNITGRMNENSLVFDKKYRDAERNDLVNYNFVNQNGIWVGKYRLFNEDSGRADCVTRLIIEDGQRVGI